MHAPISHSLISVSVTGSFPRVTFSRRIFPSPGHRTKRTGHTLTVNKLRKRAISLASKRKVVIIVISPAGIKKFVAIDLVAGSLLYYAIKIPLHSMVAAMIGSMIGPMLIRRVVDKDKGKEKSRKRLR